MFELYIMSIVVVVIALSIGVVSLCDYLDEKTSKKDKFKLMKF